MADLTPYDTGARAEPHAWRPRVDDPDSYGKVDFEDDASQTVATVHIEWDNDEKRYVVVIVPAVDISVSVRYDTPEPVPLPDLTEEEDG